MRSEAPARVPTPEALALGLEHGRRLLARDPALAERQAREIVRVVPGSARAQALLGASLAAQGRREEAIACLAAATRIDPGLAAAWRMLGTQHALRGDRRAAARARVFASVADDPATAERALDAHLGREPEDCAALWALAGIVARRGAHEDALALLDRALAVAPGFTAARFDRAVLLHRLQRFADALEEIARLTAGDPGDLAFANLKGAVLIEIGDIDGALALFEQALAGDPAQPRMWVNYGHALKAAGRQADGVAAYRRALALDPALGNAWWSLANLKAGRLDRGDVAAMTAALSRPGLADHRRVPFHFALGRALDDAGDTDAAVDHYERGNRLRAAPIGHDPDAIERHVSAIRERLDAAFFASRALQGCAARDPIFVLGMPRAGSTLIEQILASHGEVEGTQELPDIQRLAHREAAGGGDHAAALRRLAPDRLAALGQEYLERTRIHRHGSRPLFVDKMPDNWLHVPLIQLILPNATIIDARRHPLDCCLSNYRQHFAQGRGFSYDLAHLGRYYAAYVALMEHVDRVLPGRVHRVFHEALVEDTEGEVRRLLDHVGLAFEPGCLRFHETRRAVRTASSEQVRRPISRAAIGGWRRYGRWLAPLREALGDIVETYPFQA